MLYFIKNNLPEIGKRDFWAAYISFLKQSVINYILNSGSFSW